MKPLAFFLSASLLIETATAEDGWEWSLEGSFENTFLAFEGPSSSLIQFPEGENYAPRLSLEFDLQPSPYFYFHTTARFDRGFDPGDRPDGEFRIDEIFLRYRPAGDNRFNIQIGKFATAFGSYVQTHDFYDNPFLLAPLAYGEILGVGVVNPQANSLASIAGRANGTLAGVFNSPQSNWTTAVWGPAYTSGASIFGHIGKFDYAIEIKNVEPGANPDQWNPGNGDFDDPTISGRFAYRPDASLNLGLSFSHGPYLNPEADQLLPEGIDRGDLPSSKIGIDARWSHGDIIVSGEVIYSRYETLETEDLESLSWYLQTRWKVAPGFWLAGRVGQTVNNTLDGIPWSPDLFRSEVSFGWRVTPDLLFKAQYSYTETSGGLDGPGRNLFGCGLGWRF